MPALRWRGAAPLHYQWLFNGAPIAGATNRILRLPNVGPAAAGQYALVVTNALGALTSAPVTLSLIAPVLQFDTAPGAMWLGPDGLHLRLLGLSGAGPVVLYATTDFGHWDAVQTNGPAVGLLELVDPEASNLVRRFYRAVELIQPPGGAAAP